MDDTPAQSEPEMLIGTRVGFSAYCANGDCHNMANYQWRVRGMAIYVCRPCSRKAFQRQSISLQERIAGWHQARFPSAQSYHVALKMIEEVGEVAEALNGHLSGGRDNETTSRLSDVPQEAADVAVCLMVLLGRWFPERDLLAEVENKLSLLSNPNSGHRSASRGDRDGTV